MTQTRAATSGGRGVPIYRTRMGAMYCGKAEDVLHGMRLRKYRSKVQLVFTSPPFPLRTQKKYGNLQGAEYVTWLAGFAPALRDYVADDGSVVVEIGNAWEKGSPTMSTLPIEALLAFKAAGEFHLCQEFIVYNPARLPAPAQWVNVERIRVKDSFTRIWWLAPSRRPTCDNRRVLTEYSESMKRLLKSGRYNPGERPSGHVVGSDSFLTEHDGAIPPNVLTVANTRANDPYQEYCRANHVRPHPARMAREVAEFFVRFLTVPGDLVLDPFAGSNVTGSVAEALGRRWIAVEEKERYAEASAARFSNLRLPSASGQRQFP